MGTSTNAACSVEVADIAAAAAAAPLGLGAGELACGAPWQAAATIKSAITGPAVRRPGAGLPERLDKLDDLVVSIWSFLLAITVWAVG